MPRLARIASCAVALIAVGFGLGLAAQSPAGYVLAQVDIHDRDTYRLYEAGFGEILRSHDGEVVGGSESPQVLEGDWDVTRTVILRFESVEAALGWYESEAYQKLAENRWRASDANIVLLPGRR